MEKENVSKAERLAELLEAAYRGLCLEDKIDGVSVSFLGETPCAVIYYSHAYNEARGLESNSKIYLPYDTSIDMVLETLHGIEAQPLEGEA